MTPMLERMHRPRRRYWTWLASAAHAWRALGALCAAACGSAQASTAPPDLPARTQQSLLACLEPLAKTFHVRIIDLSAHGAPMRCAAPRKNATLDANLDALLAPNGLQWRRRDDGTIEVAAAPAAPLQLAALDIDGDPLPELRRADSAVATPLIERAVAATSLDARWLGTAPLVGFDQLSWYAPNVYGTGQTLAIRGTERRGDYFPALAVTFDGIDLGTRLLDDELVPLADVTTLLLSRSPGSFEYGYAAQAGAIALHTAAPAAEPATSLALGLGNAGARNGEVSWTGPLGIPGLAATVALDEHALPSFVRQRVVPEATVAQRHNTFARFKLRYVPESPSGLSAELSGLGLSGDSSERVVVAAGQGPTGSPPPFIPFDRISYALDPVVAQTRARGAAGFVRYDDPSHWTLDAHASLTTISRAAEELPLGAHWQDRELLRRTGFSASEHPAPDWTLVAGAEYSGLSTSFHTPSGAFVLFNRFSAESASASLWLERAWNNRAWNAGVGVRWLHERASGDPEGKSSYVYAVPIPLAVLEWRPSTRDTLTLSYGTGYRSGGQYSATTHYLPERSESVEFVWRAQWLDDAVHSTLSAFAGGARDRFSYFAGSLTDPVAGSTRDRGVEFELDAAVSERWRLRAGAGTLTSRYTSTQYRFGDATSEAPPQTLTLGVRYGLDRGWYGAADAYRAAAVDSEISGIAQGRLPAYDVVSLRAGYRSARWEASLTAANAFNAQYIERVEGSANAHNPFGFRLGDPRRIEFRVRATF